MNSRLDDLKRIVSSQADDPRAYFELGFAAQTQGEFELAIECFTKVTQLAESVAVGHFNLGNACFSLKQYAQAVTAYSRAFELSPDRSTLNNLGNSQAAMGDLSLAVATFERALSHPDDGIGNQIVLKNLGSAREALGDLAGAVDAFRQALSQRGNAAMVFQSLARLLTETDPAQALQLLQTRPAEIPQTPELLALQADCLLAQQAFQPALLCLMQACDLVPDHPRVMASLGVHHLHRGRHFESLVCLHRALASGLSMPAAHSTWLHCQLVQEPVDLAHFRQEAERWLTLANIASGTEPQVPTTRNDTVSSELSLHLGLLCGRDAFQRLNVFLRPLIEQSIYPHVTVTIYADCHESAGNTRAQSSTANVTWRYTRDLGDRRVKELIESDGVDVLIDLTGHVQGSRLGVMALRSAPVQIAWAGWLATSGVDQIDAIIADNQTVLADEAKYFTERVCWMQSGMFCCVPPGLIAEASDLEATESPVFGSVCSPIQLSDKLVSTWCNLLRQLPQARLVITDAAFGDASVREEILAKFQKGEVDARQVELSVADNITVFLKSVRLVLDPFPWNAAEIACQALQVGTPVIALRGNRFSSRTSASVLTCGGFDDWIADTPDNYCLLAMQQVRTTSSRRNWQAKVANSRLCDTPGWLKEFLSCVTSDLVGSGNGPQP